MIWYFVMESEQTIQTAKPSAPQTSNFENSSLRFVKITFNDLLGEISVPTMPHPSQDVLGPLMEVYKWEANQDLIFPFHTLTIRWKH